MKTVSEYEFIKPAVYFNCWSEQPPAHLQKTASVYAEFDWAQTSGKLKNCVLKLTIESVFKVLEK